MSELIKQIGCIFLSLIMVFAITNYGLLPVRVEALDSQTSIVYEAENYYSGNISDGATADLQPNERIEIMLSSSADFTAGLYTLTVNSCGNRTSFEILVNGVSVGSINRTGTGFGLDQITGDSLATALKLNPEDTVTLVAPADGYGWVDSIQLEQVKATETGDGYYLYQTECYYSGNISEGIAADLQPGELIAITLNDNSAFTAGLYTLTVNSCGNRTSYEILVNGESVGTITRDGTDFGQNSMTENKLNTVLELTAGDVITIVSPDDNTYGWVDWLKLEQINATETGDGYYLYHTEYYYSGNISEGVAADLQPGESIAVVLNSNPDFSAGKYTLTVNSCGSRTSFEILVNGESIGIISRTATDFGQNQMTADPLSTVLELSADDVITIVAPDSGYGWIDWLTLNVYTEPASALEFHSASLVLENGISVNFKAKAELFTDGGDYSNPYAVFTLNGVVNTVAGVYDDASGMWLFRYYNIRPDWMNDKISATLYAVHEGITIQGQTKLYSVSDYCYNMLNTTYGSSTADQNDPMGDLLVDVLKYGAAAQLYTGYNTGSLVTGDLVGTAWEGWGNQDALNLQSHQSISKDLDAPSVQWKGVALFLRETPRIRIRFATELTDALTVVAKCGSQNWTIPSNALSFSGNICTLFFDELNVTQMHSPVSFTVMSGETAVSNTLTYSIETYVANAIAANTDAKLTAIMKALIRYGNSAANYAATLTAN